jgi:hypothetical protein
VRVLLLVVQHTFGGFSISSLTCTFGSQRGVQESNGRWIDRLEYGKRGFIELMQACRAVVAHLDEALKGGVLTSALSAAAIFEAQYKRGWHIDLSRRMSTAHFLRDVGRSIRRLPVAQHRLERITDQEVEYLAKDARNHNQLVRVRPAAFERLLAPRSRARIWVAVFILLDQKRRPHPRGLSWRWLLRKTFGIDPLLDRFGQTMRWVGRLGPLGKTSVHSIFSQPILADSK